MPPADPRPFVTRASFLAASTTGDLPAPTGVEIAFAGRSNVGKSSLLNAITGRKGLARTSSTPGATRAIVLFDVETRDGARLTLVDLPGYGYAKRSKAERALWGQSIEDYILGRATLAAVAVLFDARRGLEPDDRLLLELLASPARVSRRPLGVVLIATKLDKVGVAARKPILEAIRRDVGAPVVGFSVDDVAARETVWRALTKAAGLAPPPRG